MIVKVHRQIAGLRPLHQPGQIGDGRGDCFGKEGGPHKGYPAADHRQQYGHPLNSGDALNGLSHIVKPYGGQPGVFRLVVDDPVLVFLNPALEASALSL